MLEDEDNKSQVPEGEKKGLDRILAVSDGVFAFAITLLVLGLAVPTLSQGESRTSINLLKALSGEFPVFYSYLVSFSVISIWWTAHHRLFRSIVKYDLRLMWSNLFFLLFVTVIPFLTLLLDEYGDIQIAVVIYDLVQASGGFALSLIWHYVSINHRLISESLTSAQIRQVRLRTYVPVIVFLLTAMVAFFIPEGIPPASANFLLFLIIPLTRLVSRKVPTEE